MCGPRPMLSAEPPPRNGIITIHEGWWTGWLLTEGVAGPGIKGPRWRKKETISRLYSGRTSGGRRFLRTMRLLLLLSSLSLFLLLPLHARAYVRESRFFSPFTPLPGSFSLSSILLPPPLLFLYPRPFRVPGRCGSRGLSAKVRKDNRSPRGTHRSMIQHERKPTGRQEIAVPGRTQIWIYAGPGTALVCHACKSAGGWLRYWISISDRYCEDSFRRVWEMKGPGKKKIRGLGFLILDIIFRENWKVILSDRFCETILILWWEDESVRTMSSEKEIHFNDGRI